VRLGGGRHCPPSLQVDAAVYEPEVQVSGAHIVSVPYCRQAPLPSQVPSVPQDAAPVSLH